MENTTRAGHKLLFKGEEYRLDQLLSLAKSGPPIEVTLEQLNMLGVKKPALEAEELPYVARHEPSLQEYREHLVVFFKQEGKFTVLFGHDKLSVAIDAGNKVFRGKLISGPQIKKARIEKPINVAEAIKEKVQETSSFNASRVSQDRRPPQGERRGLTNPTARAPRAGERSYGSNETSARRDFRKS